MTRMTTLLTTAALAATLGACATYDDASMASYDDGAKYRVGVDDNDRFDAKVIESDGTVKQAENTDVELPDEMQFGINDDDQFEARVVETDYILVANTPMYANKTIVQNASTAPNLTTLVAAVKQAELVDDLSAEGPYTVFAPTDAAFAEVPSEKRTYLMKDENRAELEGLLTAHVVKGQWDTAQLQAKAIENGGSFEAETLSGDTLTFTSTNTGALRVSDEQGRIAIIQTADVYQSNGVVHVIDNVLMPL